MRSSFLLFLCVGLCFGARQWHFTRLGKPQTQLPSFGTHALAMLEQNCPSRWQASGDCHWTTSEYAQIQQAIDRVAGENGMRAISETRTNGDCCPDSILRNIERLERPNAHAQEVLNVLNTRGREAALRVVRQRLCDWALHHRRVEILPGVSFTDFITMEGIYTSLEAWANDMRTSHVWADELFLYAASALFECQIVIWNSGEEPQLLVSPTLQGMQEIPVMVIACINRQHFVAFESIDATSVPDAVFAPPDVDSHDDPLLAQTLESDDVDTIVVSGLVPSNLTENHDVCCVREAQHMHESNPNKVGEAIMRWTPFSSAVDIPAELTDMSDLGHLSVHVNTTLGWRESVKAWQLEEQDRAQHLNREHMHVVANNYRAQYGCRTCKRSKKSERICTKLSIQRIRNDLKPNCAKHGAAHTCLDMFRAHPEVVLKWRRLWFGLPKIDRQDKLVGAFRESREAADKRGEHHIFKMQFQVLGLPVCRQAFMQITSLSASEIQAARGLSDTNSLAVPKTTPGLWVSRRPIKTMDARSWLLDYAKTYGDTSPLHDQLSLPIATKEFYYLAYVHSWTNAGTPADQIASKPLFLSTWRDELPWIVIKTSESLFVSCGLCEYLKLLVAKTSESSLRSLALNRLGAHFDFQAAQRIAMTNMFRNSERNPTELIAVAWDKMDQVKTLLPRVKVLKDTSFVQHGERLPVGLVGVLCPALWKEPFIYTVCKNCVEGGDMVSSILLDFLGHCHDTLGRLPRRVFIQADNTNKETKNTCTLFTISWLLVHLRETPLECIEMGFLVVGHTHDLIDAFFSLVGRVLRHHDCLSLYGRRHGLFTLLERGLKTPPQHSHLHDMYDWTAARPNYLSSSRVTGITSTNHIRVFWDRSSTISLQYKRWLTDEVWSPPVLLLDATEIQQIEDIWPEPTTYAWRDPHFQSNNLRFLARMQELLKSISAFDASELEELRAIAMLTHPLHQHSGATLHMKIRGLLGSVGAPTLSLLPSSTAYQELLDGPSMLNAFHSTALAYTNAPQASCSISTRHTAMAGNSIYNGEPIAPGMIILFQHGDAGIPIRVGRVMRVADEDPANIYVIIQGWWPFRKEKNDNRLNIFGTWALSRSPIVLPSHVKKRRRREIVRENMDLIDNRMIPVTNVLVWPVTLEEGNLGADSDNEDEAIAIQSGRIPFSAFVFLHLQHSIDCSDPQWCWGERGQEYLESRK